MKKSILTLICLIAAIGISQAQLFPTFKVGLKGGLGFSSLRSEGRFLNSDTKTGFQLGAWGRVGIAGFHVQPEVYYASKKAGISLENGEEGDATFKSMDVPILLGTRIGIGPIGARIQAGPVFSFAQDGKVVNLSEATNWDAYKKNSTGIIGGIGADISSFTVDLRYEHGLTNLNETGNQKIRMWTIGVGFSFL
ncbi:outer membrane protein with beta-barrel domain [Sphingobacterium allocomposti]|uniref:Outer membrane protein with beta-barrel domain n=1 Tax=Sphingobacterium allocomposti TaxID=415956 RepID=A0A5S5DA99_9SPHI|nr:porin family protein [Sphingobacterium composti Yoo et al. 2007 non Ten et al. 2007]TYP91539.1 outer membrane protein with beta-barrel domain [Sphingobacterium composti Yoo et al. 2007 non Ten et al. 2007]